MVVVFFVVIGGIATTFYINLKKQSTITTEAIVTYVGNNYIVVSDENDEEYFLQTDRDYNVGDRVLFTMKDIKKDSYPKEGTLEKLDTISKTVEFSISDDSSNESNNSTTDTENNSDLNNGEQNQTTSNNSSSNQSQNTVVIDEAGELAVVSYFETLNTNLGTYSQNKSLGQTIKSGFVTCVDFLFYGGEIKGYTFDELSVTAKLKVLKLAFSIDSKIENHFPGYKEQISATGNKIYTNVKSKAVELYLDITTKVCENNSDTCEAAKEGLSDLKTNFSLTWDFIKDISGVGVSKLKAWYEVWREV